jgi:hypothetical protein
VPSTTKASLGAHLPFVFSKLGLRFNIDNYASLTASAYGPLRGHPNRIIGVGVLSVVPFAQCYPLRNSGLKTTAVTQG